MVDHIVILIPLVAFWFACVLGLQTVMPIFKRKPFSCAKCMAFWLALSYQFYLGFNLNSVWIVAISSLSGYLWEVVFGKLNIPYNK